LVAYTWSNVKTLRYELRVADTNARPGATPRVLIDNPDISRLMPLDWSPDGRTIATRIVRGDRTTQLALVSALDGRVAVLKSIDWRGPTRAFFSGDGKYLAYDLISEDSSNQRDVFVLRVDGSHESRVVEHPANDLMAGWSSDGRLLIFASDRSGSRAIWGQSLKDGRPDGPPVLLRSDVGAFVGSLGITQNGALVFVQRTSADKVYSASIDFSTGRLVTPAGPVLETYLRGQRQPAWSWDGKSLAWSSAGDVMIQSLDTGRTADVHSELASGALQSWAPDGSLTFTGFDVKGRSGLFRVDARDGHVTPLVTDGLFGLPSWSADGKLLAYRHQMTTGGVIVVHDMSTGSQREVLTGNEVGYFAMAPDGGSLAYAAPFQQPRSIRILNLVTGSSRELLKAEATETFSALQWLPDSRRIVVWKTAASNTTGAVVSLAGDPLVQLDRTLPNFFRIHPDGKRIVYSAASATSEVWSLEAFLPSAKKN
jgi:Tol biopolymer transport system component